MTHDFDNDDDYEECGECGNMCHNSETECAYCNAPRVKNKIYVEKNFTRDHQRIINTANDIISEYSSDGLRLTLRQIYYQFIAQDIFENTLQSYKRFGEIIKSARLAGQISFTAIEDRNRVCHEAWAQPNCDSVLDDIEYAYREDMWVDRDSYCEVWVEKDALSNIIERPCDRYRVARLACKGFMSSSALWEAGNRFKKAVDQGKYCVLIHLGDHDPSGIDMTRDNGAKLEMFTGEGVEVRRIALNMDQVKEYKPPSNYAKLTDSRAKEYVKRFGEKSWELDALKPNVIDELISHEIKSLIDFDTWDERIRLEQSNRLDLSKISENKDAVYEFVRNL